MRKVVFALVCIVALALVVTFFIPSVQKNEVFVSNTFQNIVSTAMKPVTWIKWDSSVRIAWEKDSSACRFLEDTASHISTIEIPGKKITITQVSYLLYRIDETRDGKQSTFIFSIVPYVGNQEARSFHNSRIGYAQDSRFLYKILPFLKPRSFADRAMSGLISYLDNPTRFYGLPVQFKTPSDTIFLTQQLTVANRNDIFKTIPYLFHQVDSFALAHQVNQTGSKNISFEFLKGDSTRIMAGIHINRIIEGDYLVQCRQMPAAQVLVTGTYEGPFSGRLTAYKAMDKYISDHQLVKASADYERYLSDLPTSDSSLIKIELVYPLRSSIAE